MFTDFILWLSDAFVWSYKILPVIGYWFGWILTIVGSVWFIYWCKEIKSWGNH
jgi:hypothetical protein